MFVRTKLLYPNFTDTSSKYFAHHTINTAMRENIQPALLFGLLLLMMHISDRASVLPSNAPERRVATTAVYTVASGIFIHSSCEITLHHLGYDKIQTEPQQSSPLARPSCLPYAVTVAALVGRGYVYYTGGYGDAEWKVIQNLPAYAKQLIEDWGLRARAVLYQDRVPLCARRMEDDDDRLKS